MLKLLKKLRDRRRDRKPDIRERSTERWQDLTADEGAYIGWALRNEQPACPDCEQGQLLRGPEGCGSQNCLCSHCKAEFNLFFFDGRAIGERLQPPGGDPERAKTLYGIT